MTQLLQHNNGVGWWDAMNIQKKLINTTRFHNYLPPQSMLSSAIRAGHVLGSGDNGLGHKRWAVEE